jgi:hypothetical protein
MRTATSTTAGTAHDQLFMTLICPNDRPAPFFIFRSRLLAIPHAVGVGVLNRR